MASEFHNSTGHSAATSALPLETTLSAHSVESEAGHSHNAVLTSHLGGAKQECKAGLGRCGMLGCSWTKPSNNWAAAWYPHVELSHPELVAAIAPSDFHTNPRTGMRWIMFQLPEGRRHVCEFCKRAYSSTPYLMQHTCGKRKGSAFRTAVGAAPSVEAFTTASEQGWSAAAFLFASAERAQFCKASEQTAVFTDTGTDILLRAGARTLGAVEPEATEASTVASNSTCTSTWLSELLACCRAHGVRASASAVQSVYAVATKLLLHLLTDSSVFSAFSASTTKMRISRAYLDEQAEMLRQLTVRDRDPLAPRMLTDRIAVHLLGLCTRGLHVRHPHYHPTTRCSAASVLPEDDVVCIPCSVTELCACTWSHGSLLGLPHLPPESTGIHHDVLAFQLPSMSVPSWFRGGAVELTELQRSFLGNVSAAAGMALSGLHAALAALSSADAGDSIVPAQAPSGSRSGEALLFRVASAGAGYACPLPRHAVTHLLNAATVERLDSHDMAKAPLRRNSLVRLASELDDMLVPPVAKRFRAADPPT